MSARSEMAAGLLLAGDPWSDGGTVMARAENDLRLYLHPSTVWLSADLPAELRGEVAHGQEIPRWRAADDLVVDSEEQRALETVWSAALPPLDRGMRRYLRVRVDSPGDVARLRAIGEVDGLMIVPSLDAHGPARPLRWQWPLRVGVLPGPEADGWLATVQDTEHHGFVFDAERFDASHTYDIAIVSATDLSALSDDEAAVLGEVASCLIVAGDGPVEPHLIELDGRVGPTIGVAIGAPPEAWWRLLFSEMTHDVPIDAAAESLRRQAGVDTLYAGPLRGMDVTASAHWFAAVAVDDPRLEPIVDELAGWDWRFESGGARTGTDWVRSIRGEGDDPTAIVAPPGWALAEALPSFDEEMSPRRRARRGR
ncbi:MAG TPA: hypothetical protein VK507_19445, partial [Iamia sp.]|nr:hypothetical protein [Iamia sp.]